MIYFIIIGYILFLTVLGSLYFFVDTENELFYKHIIITLFSLNVSIIFYLIYKYNKIIKSFFDNNFAKINYFIDKYLIYSLLIIFLIFINYLTFSKHLNYYSSGFDLGIFDQVVYKYSNLEFPASSSIREISNIEGDHFHPILILYGILYKIYASPLVLIFIQNLFFVLGGLGIYKISKLKLNIPIIGLLLVFLYLIFRGNINALFFDFHPFVVAVSLFPWLYYFSIQRKWIAYFLLLIPILLSKENLSLYIVFFGLYQSFVQKEKLVGILSFLIGAIYFYLVMNHILPFMGGGGKYWSYDAIGANPKDFLINSFLHPLEIFKIMFSYPDKLVTYLHHLGTGGYIGFFSPAIIFLIPSYTQKFLSSREEFWTLNFHYSIDVFWVIAIGIIFIFSKLKNRYNYLIIIFGIFIFLNSSIINLYKSPLLKLNYYLENKDDLEEIIKKLPKNPKLSTQNNIIPHFSQNNNIYVFPDLGNSEYILINTKIKELWPLGSGEELDYLIERLRNKQNLENIKMPYIVGKLDFNKKYDLIEEKNGVLLFKYIEN